MEINHFPGHFRGCQRLTQPIRLDRLSVDPIRLSPITVEDEEIYKTHPKGHIGLQVHGIKKGTGPFDVQWRNIRVKELK